MKAYPSRAFVFIILVSLSVLVLGGCDPVGQSPSSSSGSPSLPSSSSEASAGSGPTSAGPQASAGPGSEPDSAVSEYRVSYDWGVPVHQVEVKHAVTPPIAAPPAPALPCLVGIYAADHQEGTPTYQRLSFYFLGALPSYQFGYVSSVVSEGKGDPIVLPGNSFLRMGFVDAQAHDGSGRSSVVDYPPTSLGFTGLKGYGFAGDFEGHVTYGLGIQVASNSDQVRQIRVGELKKVDRVGGTVYVVFVDVRS
jgi:hypothetical protein